MTRQGRREGTAPAAHRLDRLGAAASPEAASVEAIRISQIRGTQSRCSGFIRTERRQVIVSPSRTDPGKVEETDGQLRQRQMQVAARRLVEDPPRGAEASRTLRRARRADDDVELRRESRDEPRVGGDAGVERGCRVPAGGKHPRELSSASQGKPLEGRPERHGARSRPGALEADLAQMQLGRAEVGVRRVVLVQLPDRRVAEEHAAAAVGLKAMLVRIDDDRVRLSDALVGGVRLRAQIVRQPEVPSVRGVRVKAEAVLLAQGENLRQRIDRNRSRSFRSSPRPCPPHPAGAARATPRCPAGPGRPT